MSTSIRRFLFGFAVATAAAIALPAAASGPAYVPIERRLTSEQFHATGLDQLSATQLAALNAILASDTAPARPRDQSSGFGGFGDSRPTIEAKLAGRFTGWTTGTVFTLDDGSRWQVTQGSFDSRAVDSPRVTIKPGILSGWYMYVEGQPVVASVKRVR
ncbi:hypothetical protein [Lysobacter sp. HA18]